jgi:hypothetical protein
MVCGLIFYIGNIGNGKNPQKYHIIAFTHAKEKRGACQGAIIGISHSVSKMFGIWCEDYHLD